MTPVPGSFTSTRAIFSAASSVPSATITWPAWIERPMPTPPPWWIDTHVAPEAVFSRAFSSGQSAIASEPSAIASVSRYVVATDDHGGAELARCDHLVELQPREVALLVAEPADAGGQALEVHLLAGLRDPPAQVLVVGEELEDRPVGRGDVGRVAREGCPPERPLALGEQRADVCGYETRELERPVVAAELRLAADGVAVVEDLGAGILESDHRGHLLGHASPCTIGESLGIPLRLGVPVLEGDAHGQVRQRVVGARLVGHDVDRHLAGA